MPRSSAMMRTKLGFGAARLRASHRKNSSSKRLFIFLQRTKAEVKGVCVCGGPFGSFSRTCLPPRTRFRRGSPWPEPYTQRHRWAKCVTLSLLCVSSQSKPFLQLGQRCCPVYTLDQHGACAWTNELGHPCSLYRRWAPPSAKHCLPGPWKHTVFRKITFSVRFSF